MDSQAGMIGHGAPGDARPTLYLEGPDRPRGNRAWWIGGGLVVLVLALAAWAFHAMGHKPAGKAVEQVPSVTIVVPGRSTVSRQIAATGTIAAKRDQPVGIAGEGGRVTAVLVEPGQWVKAGQVLATIDRSVQVETAASLAAQVKVAQADATLAQADLDRANKLVDRGFISKADIDTKTATRDAALAKLNVARASLAETNAKNGRLNVRAPTDGLILTRTIEAGQIVSSGSGTLFRIAMDGELEMRAALAESDLVGLRVGAPATVTPVGGAQGFQGHVWQIAPVIDPTTRQGVARIQLTYDPALKPGGFASAVILSGASQAPTLPQSAIQSDPGGQNYVYILDAQNRAVRRNVKLGQVSDSGVAIASGLDGSERVVLQAGAFLAPGQLVKPVLQKL